MSGGRKPFATMLFLSTLALAPEGEAGPALGFGDGGAQAAEKPLSAGQVEELISAEADSTRLVLAIRERGIEFLPYQGCLEHLRGLGANENVIRTLRAARGLPFNKKDLLRESARRQGDGGLEEQVRQRGIDFDPTDEDLDTLRVAGAGPEVLEAIRAAKRVHPPSNSSSCAPEPMTPGTTPASGGLSRVATSGGEPSELGKSAASVSTSESGEKIALTPAEIPPGDVPAAGLDFLTDPPGAEVLIDGRSFGPSPIRTALAAGRHTYTVRQAYTKPFEKSFLVTAGTIKIIKVVFVPPPVPPTGTLVVRSDPPGATVEVDGGPLGGPTPVTFTLPAGLHTLRITLEGHPAVVKQIRLSENKPLAILENFRRTRRKAQP